MLYFAYGSNLDLDQMKHRCPQSSLQGAARLPGYELGFTHYSPGWNGGVADIVEKEGQEVWGLVFEITETDRASLDKYEGYPDAYTRFQVAVHTDATTLQGVWVYSVVDKKDIIAPSQRYLNIIRSAARQFAFPQAYQDSLSNVMVKEN